MIVFTEALAQLARRVRSAPALRVFMLAGARLDFEAWRRLDQRQVAAELGTDDGTVSRAMRELVQVGVLERRGRGPLIEWRLSLTWGWRGNVAAYHAACRERDALVRENAEAELVKEAHPEVAEWIVPSPAKSSVNPRKQRSLRLLSPLPSGSVNPPG